MRDMSEIVATQQNVESLMKYFDTIEPLNQWRTKVKKLEIEKKELLKTNYVISVESFDRSGTKPISSES